MYQVRLYDGETFGAGDSFWFPTKLAAQNYAEVAEGYGLIALVLDLEVAAKLATMRPERV